MRIMKFLLWCFKSVDVNMGELLIWNKRARAGIRIAYLPVFYYGLLLLKIKSGIQIFRDGLVPASLEIPGNRAVFMLPDFWGFNGTALVNIHLILSNLTMILKLLTFLEVTIGTERTTSLFSNIFFPFTFKNKIPNQCLRSK